MSEHRSTLIWNRDGSLFDYRSYSRNHLWKFENGLEVEASATSQFLGDASKVDPEEAYVASLSSCHMLTFLAVAARKKLTVDSYEDHAVGYLEKNEEGKLAITKIDLHPKVIFEEGLSVSHEELSSLHELAHHECFIANSVKTEIKTIIDIE
jgi:organic hydroperoxide reductase OsmC/OhrA